MSTAVYESVGIWGKRLIKDGFEDYTEAELWVKSSYDTVMIEADADYPGFGDALTTSGMILVIETET